MAPSTTQLVIGAWWLVMAVALQESKGGDTLRPPSNHKPPTKKTTDLQTDASGRLFDLSAPGGGAWTFGRATAFPLHRQQQQQLQLQPCFSGLLPGGNNLDAWKTLFQGYYHPGYPTGYPNTYPNAYPTAYPSTYPNGGGLQYSNYYPTGYKGYVGYGSVGYGGGGYGSGGYGSGGYGSGGYGSRYGA